MNTVSFETAKRLKEAGFPQSDFQFGQLWMTEDERHFAFVGTAQMEQLRQHHIGQMIFLPAATDILRELGERYVLWFDDSPKVMKWICARAGDFIQDAGKPIVNDNPAEAAATAWFESTDK